MPQTDAQTATDESAAPPSAAPAPAAAPADTPVPSPAAATAEKPPRILKAFGLLCIVVGVVSAAIAAFVLMLFLVLLRTGELSGQYYTATLVIYLAEIVLLGVLSVFAVLFGLRLMKGLRRFAAKLLVTMLVLVVGAALCDIMLNGFGASTLPFAVITAAIIGMESYLDPALAQERRLQRRLRSMEDRTAAEEGTLGLDQTGRGCIALNFFNLFWIFVICSFLGLVVETILIALPTGEGILENRAGLVVGPFSPIYGVGAVLMTLVLNEFHDRNVVLVFVLGALVGGAFEYLVSWFLQFAFGIVAWDYSSQLLSIGGRTSIKLMIYWGVLAVIWVKLALPWLLKLINKIPWNWRYGVTVACAIVMFADCALTLVAFDCWYQRQAGTTMDDTAIVQFVNTAFDDEFMESRFQSMTIDVESATRTD